MPYNQTGVEEAPPAHFLLLKINRTKKVNNTFVQNLINNTSDLNVLSKGRSLIIKGSRVIKLLEHVYNPMASCMKRNKPFFFSSGLFRCKVFLNRAYTLERNSLDEMKRHLIINNQTLQLYNHSLLLSAIETWD